MVSAHQARPVKAEHIEKTFDESPVLRDVSLTIGAGEIYSLLGPSGCGKTTLLRILAGLESPDQGKVTIGDQVVAGPGQFVVPEKRGVGLVFQDWALFPHMSVAKNVGYGLHGEGAQRIDQTLDMVGLSGFGDRSPSTLSGGQKQRVALARALAPRPSVLLLDEPFSNLDTTLRVSIRTEVHALLHELGITSVFVTHDQDEAFVVGDQVAVMHQGRIEQVATPHDLYREPASPWVASFVGDVNLIPGVASGTSATTGFGTIALSKPASGDVQVAVRPEQLHAALGGPHRIALVEYYGHDTVLLVDTTHHNTVRVRVGPGQAFAHDDLVTLEYRGEPTVAFPAPPPLVD